jgi:hypothetical protein
MRQIVFVSQRIVRILGVVEDQLPMIPQDQIVADGIAENRNGPTGSDLIDNDLLPGLLTRFSPVMIIGIPVLPLVDN